MHKVILDIDSVGDDILAVLFGLHNTDLDILGITTVNGACGSIEQANKVALNVVALTDKKVPIYSGAEKPLVGETTEIDGDPVNFDDALRWKLGERLDGFNAPEKEPANEVEEESAVEFMIRTINENPGEITVVTTGPVTNLALALQKDNSIADKIKEAYILGGCFHVPGNITPITEYNIWADPEAAKIVLESNIDITLVPLDVCENNDYADGMMTRDHLSDLELYGSGRVVDYIINKFPIYIDIWREFFQLGGFPMDDVITLALVTHPHLCEYTPYCHVDVELEGSLSRGQTVPFIGYQIINYEKKNHKNVRIANRLYGKEFMNLFVDTIINEPK